MIATRKVDNTIAMEARCDKQPALIQLEKDVKLLPKNLVEETVQNLGFEHNPRGTKERLASLIYRGIMDVLAKNRIIGITDQSTLTTLGQKINIPQMNNAIRKLVKSGHDGPRRVEPPVTRNFNAIDNIKDYFRCLCDNRVHDELTTQCLDCQRTFHDSCLRVPKGERFECPYCFAINMDPQNQVKLVLFCGYMMAGNKVNRLIFPYRQDEDFAKLHVEIRCFRLDGKNNYSITWPDIGDIKLNDQKIHEMKALAENSSLKKRKDEIKTFDRRQLRFNNTLLVTEPYSYAKELRVGHYNHFIMVCLTKSYSNEQLYTRILNTAESVTHAERKQNNNEYEIEMEKVYIELKCVFSLSRIEIPVKGRECEHDNCVDLRNSISFNNRSWRCPICKKKSHYVRINRKLHKIIKDNKHLNIAGVTFLKDGTYAITEEKNDDSEDDESSFKQKTKPPLIIDLEESEESLLPQPPKSPEVVLPRVQVLEKEKSAEFGFDPIDAGPELNSYIPLSEKHSRHIQEEDQRMDNWQSMEIRKEQEWIVPKNEKEVFWQTEKNAIQMEMEQIDLSKGRQRMMTGSNNDHSESEQESESVVLLQMTRKHPQEPAVAPRNFEQPVMGYNERECLFGVEDQENLPIIVPAPVNQVAQRKEDVIQILDSDEQSEEQKLNRLIKGEQYQLRQLFSNKNLVPGVSSEAHYHILDYLLEKFFPGERVM